LAQIDGSASEVESCVEYGVELVARESTGRAPSA